MDAHVFRRLCDVLAPLLTGARLEKIQSPAEQVFVFSFYAAQRKCHLVLRAGRRDPFLYMAKERPVAGVPPSALVMRWRKYCAGRRVAACVPDWAGRRLLLLFRAPLVDGIPLPPEDAVPETWLILDLREGPQLVLGKSPDLPEEQQWPLPPLLADACHNWRQWPVLTPALRRTLPHLEELDQQALLADLEAGGGDLFCYGKGKEAELWAWPLPPELSAGRKESVLEDPLVAASLVGDALVLGSAAQKSLALAAQPHVREAARLIRLLEKLRSEEKRLRDMAQGQEKGMVLQSILWRFAPGAKEGRVETDDARHPVLELDKKRTVRENMGHFFHQAARGRRGLEFLVQRREVLEAQLLASQSAALAVEAGAVSMASSSKGAGKTGRAQNSLGSERGSGSPGSGLNLPRGVQAFRSSDGFIILRGRDAKGNWAALRAAAAQDLWLHVEGGPGSHAIIRRTFAGQEIPQRTLLEAASLAAVKSWQKDSPWAHILCAQVRHVKPMRGAAPGTVRIDKAGESFRVDIDTTVEERLAL